MGCEFLTTLAPVVVLDFGNLNFGFVSDLDIRISNLPFHVGCNDKHDNL